MKIRLAGAEVFHAGGWTDGQANIRTHISKLTVAFCNLADALKVAFFLKRKGSFFPCI